MNGSVSGPRSGRARALGESNRSGTITLISGCMFSGKTTDLLRFLRRVEPNGGVAFKHAIDDRYGQGEIVTHGGQAHRAISVWAASQIRAQVTRRTVLVAIDEAHFFDPGLADVVGQLSSAGMDLVLTCLEPDSWGRTFPIHRALSAMATSSMIKRATCARCGGLADRTQRTTPIIHGRLVGGAESYEPRCRRCWRPPPEEPPE